MSDLTPIDSFSGEFRWLSNFWEDSVPTHDGPTVEHRYQAAKACQPDDHLWVLRAPSPGQAKRRGRRVKIRSDWEDVKDDVMLQLLRIKFTVPENRALLLGTGARPLIEGNYWGDTYWGVCRGVGQNRLGVLLMQVRREISYGLDFRSEENSDG